MIDPKELRIGAHVDCKGSRYEVCGIYGDFIALIVKRHPLKGCKTVPFSRDYLSPIPITEELLTELGFEKRESSCAYAKEYAPDSWIFVTLYATKELCKVSVYPSDFKKEASCILDSYLHELEAFLYLTTKTELIKE